MSRKHGQYRYGYADVAGPTALIGKKMLPVLTWHDSEGQAGALS